MVWKKTLTLNFGGGNGGAVGPGLGASVPSCRSRRAGL
jgi:hypothetical protein